MAGSGRYSVVGVSRYGGTIDFDFTSAVVGPGVTRVDWTLTARGRSSSPTLLQTKGKIYVNDELVWTGSGSTMSYVNNRLTSGSFFVNHSTSGAGTFNVYSVDAYIYQAATNLNATVWLDSNYPYTDCEAPTSVWAADVSTEGRARVTWSGADDGVANPITGYRIYYSTSSNVTESDSYKTASASASEITISLSRGTYYYFRVKAMGAHGNSGLSSHTTWTYMNQVPKPPVCHPVRIAHKKTRGVPNVSGSDPDGDKVTLEYGHTYDSWKTYKPGTELDADTVYEFRTIDQHGEASSKITVTPIIRNPAPTMTIKTQANPALQSQTNNTDKKYARNILFSLTGNTGVSGVNIKGYNLYYKTSSDGISFSSEKFARIYTTGSSATSANIPFSDSLVPRGTYFKVGASMVTAVYEDVTDIKFSDEIYYIPPAPSIRKMCNNFSNTNLDYSFGHFGNRMRMYFDYDEDVSAVNITLEGDKIVPVGAVDLTSRGSLLANGYSDFYLPEGLTPGVRYKVKATFSSNYASDNVYSDYFTVANKINMVDNLKTSKPIVKPYTETELTFSIRNPYGVTQIDYSSLYIKDDKDFRFYFVNSEGEVALPTSIITTPPLQITPDTLNFAVDTSKLLGLIRGKLVKDGIKSTGSLRGEVVDIFGRKFTGFTNLAMDLREPIVGVTNLTVTKNGAPLKSGDFIYKDDKIEFSYSVTDYNMDNVQIIIQKSASDTDTEPKSWVTQLSTNLQLANYGSYKQPFTTSGKTSYVVGDIISKKYIRYRVLVRDTVSEKTGAWSVSNVIRVAQVAAAIDVKGYSLEDVPSSTGQRITINYNIENLGIDPPANLGKAELSSEYYTDLTPNKPDTFKKVVNGTGASNLTLNYILPVEANYAMVRLVLTTYTKNATYQDEKGKKNTYTTYLMIPNTLATYSYRKNQFGINTNALDMNQNVGLLVGYKKDKSLVVFQGPDGKKYTFNLEDGTMEGFGLNGGTW